MLEKRTTETCSAALVAVKDALYVLGGKWKLPIIVSLQEGPCRFKELQRRVEDITPRVLSKELKEMELNDLVTRRVISTTPVIVEYSLTAYSETLTPLTNALHAWGSQHRQRVFEKARQEREHKLLQSEPA